jgi:creatinine amidohydrolase
MRLERMTWPEVKAEIDAGTPLALPVGAIEQHGPHLPLGTDGFIPQHIATQAAERRRLVVAPPLFYGAYSRPRSGGGRHFPGSVGLPGRVLEQVIHHLVEDWLRQGFRKIVVLNGHFENAWTLLEGIEQAVEKHRDTSKVLLVNWWDQVADDDISRIFGDAFPGWATEHASITETSMLEAFAPGLVRTELKADGGARRLVSYDIFPPTDDILWPNGIGYSATAANAATGKELTALLTGRLTKILDTEFPDNAHLFLFRHPRLPQVLEEVPGLGEVLRRGHHRGRRRHYGQVHRPDRQAAERPPHGAFPRRRAPDRQQRGNAEPQDPDRGRRAVRVRDDPRRAGMVRGRPEASGRAFPHTGA